jgi:outer membrane lipoprotein-sorting protein
MTIVRISSLAAAIMLGAAASVSAQVPLPPVRPGGSFVPPPAPEATKPEATRSGTALPANASPAAVIERVNAALNRLDVLTADFVQLSGNRQLTGKLYLQKPGKLRFDYDPPSPLEIISDGRTVAIRDRKLATQDFYSIAQTPLKFLVRDRIDLAKDLKVTGVRVDPDRVIVQVEDKATFAGTSQVTLFFEQPSMMLKRWTILDPQGHEVTVTLANPNTVERPDPQLFVIDLTIIR